MRIGDMVKEAHACSYIQWPPVDPNREEFISLAVTLNHAAPVPTHVVVPQRCQDAGRLFSLNHRFTVSQSLGMHMGIWTLLS